jgi:hypothetical protein
MKFAFVAKHRGIWPAEWLCGALGVSRGGFYAWLTRPRSQRSRSDEELGAKVRASFLASDRTYGARRVWHDMLAEGVLCGLGTHARRRRGSYGALVTSFSLQHFAPLPLVSVRNLPSIWAFSWQPILAAGRSQMEQAIGQSAQADPR